VAKLRNIGYIGEERMTQQQPGSLALDEGDADAAISDFEEAARPRGTPGTMVRTNLARAWLQKGDLRQGAKSMRGRPGGRSKSKQAELTLAGIETKAGDLKRRRSTCAAPSPSTRPSLRRTRSSARSTRKRGDYPAALAEYQKVIEIAPLSPASTTASARSTGSRGRETSAERTRSVAV